MVPIFVNPQDEAKIGANGRRKSGRIAPDELGMTVTEENGDLVITDPLNHTTVQMESDGLIAVNVIVSEHRVHVLGNYIFDKLPDICCVTLCGTTVVIAHPCGFGWRLRQLTYRVKEVWCAGDEFEFSVPWPPDRTFRIFRTHRRMR